MSRRYVITRMTLNQKAGLICAIYEEQQMIEVNFLSEDASKPLLNHIYVARVSQVVNNIGAAFVEIEKGQKCFLPLSDLKEPVYVKRISDKKLLSQGDEILVQVVREAIRTKEPQVSTNLSLAGIYSVVTSENKRLGISSKLPPERREQLRELCSAVHDGSTGMIVRTNALEVEDDLLLSELKRLNDRLKEILKYAPSRTVYSCLYQAEPAYIRFLQDQPMNELEQVITDDEEVYAELVEYAESNPAIALEQKIKFYQDKQLDLHKLYSVETQLERATAKKVWLKSGANLIIEPTEAMTVIDVNSSKNIKEREKSRQYLEVNLEAAREVAKQIRLRNISGIIIVDFIDMAGQGDQEQLLQAMRQYVRGDSVKVEVIDLTKLGLMEITRKKLRRSLYEQIYF